MEPQDVRAVLDRLSELEISPSTTEAEAMAATRPIGVLNECLLGVIRFSGETPWERHPGGDELLHMLEGEIEVTVLCDDREVRATVPCGSVFVVPRGLWHRQRARRSVALLFATAAADTESSWAPDPRSAPRS